MASISMNPVMGEHATYMMISQLKKSHRLNVLKGALVALGIVTVGVLTLAMPSLRPAADNVEDLARPRSGPESLAP